MSQVSCQSGEHGLGDWSRPTSLRTLQVGFKVLTDERTLKRESKIGSDWTVFADHDKLRKTRLGSAPIGFVPVRGADWRVSD